MGLYENIKTNIKEAEDYKANRESIINQAAEYLFNDMAGEINEEMMSYEEFTDTYMDINKMMFEKARDKALDAMQNFADHSYYDHEYSRKSLLELNDNHTLWELERENPSDSDEMEWSEIVERKLEEFRNETGEDLILTGRMGRHACVEPTFENCLHFDILQDVQERLEQEAIDEFNNPEEV